MNKGRIFRENLYFELFWEFFKLGLFTIGGGMVMLPLMQKLVVEKKGWMSEEEAVDCIAICQSLPGVIAINMATYIGRQKKGFLGAICATTGVILPSFMIIILIIELLTCVGDVPWIQGAMKGIKAAAVGLIAYTAYTVGKKVLTGVLPWIFAIGAFVAIIWLNVSAVWTVIAGIVLGLLITCCPLGKKGGGDVQ